MNIIKSHIGQVLGITLLLLTACSEFQEIEVGSPSAIIFKSFKDNKINVDLSLPITNPNDLQFKITKINLEVVVNDNYLGKITNVKNIHIPRESSENHVFNLDLEVKSVVKGILSVINILGSGTVEVESKGEIKVRSGFIAKSIPVENSANIKVKNRIPWLKEK